MELDDGLPETEAQWMEHTEAWRLAHLDRAPSPYLRQRAVSGEERGTEFGGDQGPAWNRLPHLTFEMMVILAVVAVVVIGAAVR